MANYTLTFDEKINGWTSFHSYEPEMMVNLNNDFFSFKDGQLYIHERDTNIRNQYYEQPSAPTEIELVLNDSPSDVKIFKTIEIEGSTGKWDTTVDTNLESGNIPKDKYKNKEGMFYEYIRRNESDEIDPTLLSVQGIGVVQDIEEGEVEWQEYIATCDQDNVDWLPEDYRCNYNCGEAVFKWLEESYGCTVEEWLEYNYMCQDQQWVEDNYDCNG